MTTAADPAAPEHEVAYPAGWEADVVVSDGGVVHDNGCVTAGLQDQVPESGAGSAVSGQRATNLHRARGVIGRQ